MTCGLFGKMPSKRDFVAVNAPRKFLDPFETWLQSGLATSKEKLGSEWQNLFLQAPIWRFWFGHDVCGLSAAGILMPSVDGVGRYFPLTAFSIAPDDREFVSPLNGDGNEWYEEIENLLLQTLDENFNSSPEQLVTKMNQQEVIPTKYVTGRSESVLGVLIDSEPDQTAENLLSGLVDIQVSNAMSSLSFWWTISSTGSGSRAMVINGMPEMSVFSTLLEPQMLNVSS